jgi:2-dehydropantoate 2-reductase
MLRAWKARMALGGATTLGATLTSPGVVRVSGLGRTVIGSDLNPEAAKLVARVFAASGIPASTERRISREIWAKAIVSSCINPSTAVLRIRNGELLRSETVKKFLDEVCAEGVRVARASGVSLSSKLLQKRVRAVARDTAKNTSSMLQDIQHGKRTEIDQINGAICKSGERLGIDCPLNLALHSIVLSLQSSERREKG